VQLVAAMLRGGFTPDEAGKIAGGNYMRVFRASVG
jgi:membrane dipeptidase